MILCAGEALIDMIPETTDSAQISHVAYTGGAAFNSAIALGRLGARVGLLTGLSRDPFGDLLMQGLNTSGVRTEYIQHFDQLTTLAMLDLRHGQASYRFYDDNTAGQAIQLTDIPQLPEDVEALLAGGISLINGPAALTYRGLIAREAGKRVVMLDPNIRPALVTDSTTYRAQLQKMLRKVDIVKLSDDDLDWLLAETPGHAASPQSTQSFLAELLSDGPQLILITHGADGASAHHQNGTTVSVPTQPVAIVDTVGAGDTFNAAALAYLQRHRLLSRDALTTLSETHLQSLLKTANTAAAFSVTRAGANPPWATDLPPI